MSLNIRNAQFKASHTIRYRIGPQELEMPEIPPLKVLVVDDHAGLRSLVVAKVREKYSLAVVQASSPAEASEAIRNLDFDIVFYGHPAWEEGISLLIDILSSRKSGCQFFLFTETPSLVETSFHGYVTVVAKPDWEGLIAAADWTRPTRPMGVHGLSTGT